MIHEDDHTLHYPMFACLKDKLVVVIGGGKVAERKILTLLEYQARIRVVSPELSPSLELMALSEIIEHEARPYQKGDLAEAHLALCACGNTLVNLQVYEEAEEQRIFINVVDVPELCSFIVPSVVRRDPLQIAISTAGNSPLFAKRLRLELEERYPKEYGLYLQIMGELRLLIKERVLLEEERARLFQFIDDSPVLEEVLQGALPEAEELFERLVLPALKQDIEK